jgi:hypothetical protein
LGGLAPGSVHGTIALRQLSNHVDVDQTLQLRK